jgi:hypothetical protein
MAAVVQAQIAVGAGPTLSSAEGGITFGRDDLVTSTAPIPKPTATGTAYSWAKTLLLMVTSGGGSTAITDRQIKFGSSPSTGIYGFFKDGGASYTQAAAVLAADAGTTGATPSTWTALTTSPQTWHAASVAATNSTRNGNYVLTGLGIGDNYAGGAGSAIAVPDLVLSYTEA